MLRWLRSLRETFRVLTGRDDSVQKYIAETKAQILKLREQRSVQAQQLEAKTLAEVRRVVEELKTVKESVDQMEKAAVEYVEQLGNQAEALLAEAIKVEGKVLEDIIAAQSGSPAGAGVSPLDGKMSAADREKLLQWMGTLKAELPPPEKQLSGSAPGKTPAPRRLDVDEIEKLMGKKPR